MKLHPLEKIAKYHYGVTDSLEETGYVLSDGTFLDLSGRHQASGYIRKGDRFVPEKRQPDYLYGQRNIDHRQLPSEIFDAVDTREGSEAMLAFLRETGALRFMPGAGFLVAQMPTFESVARVVREWHHAFGNAPLYVDIVSSGGRPDRASRVINPGDVRESQEFEQPTVGDVMEFLESKFGGGASMAGKNPKRKKLSPPGRVPAAVQDMIDFAEKHGLDLSIKRDNVSPLDIQVEEQVDPKFVKEIVEAIREAGGSWPWDLPYPVVTGGATMGLLDGSHRTAAAIYEGLSEIPVLVVDAVAFYEIQDKFDVSRFEYVHDIMPHLDALAYANNQKDKEPDRDRNRAIAHYEIEPGSLGARQVPASITIAEVGAFKRRSPEDISRRIASLAVLLEIDAEFVMQKKSFDAINLSDGRDFLLEDEIYDLVIVHSVLSTGMRQNLRIPGHERELLTSTHHNIQNWKDRLVSTEARYIVVCEGQPYTLSGWELGDLPGYEKVKGDPRLTVYRRIAKP